MARIPGDLFGNTGTGSLPKQRALKQQFRVPVDQPVPRSLLTRIVQTPIGGVVNGVQIDTKTKYRANFALNLANKRR
jgi:hypothetical protein